MRNSEGEASLKEVHGQAEKGLEQKGTNHQCAEENQKAARGVDAEGAGQVKGSLEVGVGLDLLGLNDKADDRDNDCEAENFDDAVGENAQKKEHRAFSFFLVEKAVNPFEVEENGVGISHKSIVQCNCKSKANH